ncbi:hypothetical protein ACLBVR_35995, partial [Pseudomonas aeruginosa]
MVFSSNVFLFLFLPVFLGLYYLSGERYRNLLLLIASYVFYAWWRVDFLLLFAGVTVFNYWIGLRIGAAGVRTRAAQRLRQYCKNSATSRYQGAATRNSVELL